MIHCLFLHRFRIGFVVEYWIGEVVLCMCMLWLLFQSCGRDITWDLVREVLSLALKGWLLGFGFRSCYFYCWCWIGLLCGKWISELSSEKTWWDYNPMMPVIFLNVSHRRGIEMVLQLQFAFAISVERRQRRSFLFYTHLMCTRYHHINMPKNVGECTPLIQ